jgi:two-component system, NarL family, sensor histidine kinase UhpB
MDLKLEKAPSINLRILFLEDNVHDVRLIKRELNSLKINFILEHVTNKIDYLAALKSFNPHIILSDYNLNLLGFDGLFAFKLMQENNMRFPFILVSETMSEYLTVQCLNLGIDDYLLKASIERLPMAIMNVYERNERAKEKYKLSIELKNSREELRLLVGSLQTSIEEERKYIAREIHDELGQVMTGLKINVKMLLKEIVDKGCVDTNYIKTEFDSVVKLIDLVFSSVKRIAIELRPDVLEHLGIIEAIKWQVTEFENKTGIRCTITELQNYLELNGVLATTVYRIVQEALTNVARHAKATTVDLMVGLKGKFLMIEIKDNGIGFNKEEIKRRKSLGLIGMRERVFLANGEIQITGVPEHGTTIFVKIPV